MSEETAGTPYRVALPEFEGPLDLLLHLCKTHEIDIVNIPISFITEKYLEYLDLMQSMTVDVAADYLVMAATLAYLKSRELVPTPEPLEAEGEDGEEPLDPRAELIRRLLEYQKYKDAAEQLGARPIEGRNIFGRGMPVEGDEGPAPLAEHSVWKLIESFAKLLEKTGNKKITHNVHFDRISISARINNLIDRLEAGSGSFRFDALFDLSLPEAELRSQFVVTLLAILELARLKVVRVLASEDAETLFITQVQGATFDEARRTHFTSDETEPEAEGEAEAAVEAEAATSVGASVGVGVADDARAEPATDIAQDAPGASPEDVEPALEASGDDGQPTDPLATVDGPSDVHDHGLGLASSGPGRDPSEVTSVEPSDSPPAEEAPVTPKVIPPRPGSGAPIPGEVTAVDPVSPESEPEGEFGSTDDDDAVTNPSASTLRERLRSDDPAGPSLDELDTPATGVDPAPAESAESAAPTSPSFNEESHEDK